MSQLILHDYEMDEDSYRVRLLMSFLGVTAERVAVDMFPGHVHDSPAFRRLSPLGLMPVLEIHGTPLAGSAAILATLAACQDETRQWLPTEPALHGDVMSWLTFSERALAAARQARLCALFALAGDTARMEAEARSAFRVLEDRMTLNRIEGRDWIVGTQPTIADLALFPSFALSRDYGIDHNDYPALRLWLRRLRRLPGFITMPGIPDYH
ncbi:glutathione S-transferase [Xaviernesmea oryzae]|uniref:Glutathione S-transferase n=1 Tax=Xaviernesmea oryzae TaxID=464029 RepID=A0A1Q9AXW2_9HYPH|nr:glutathione S-transferase family protein [Xaviernesmea oryzae]OLP60260.1 glutathione S-transferase [Xaviernesmea oryzae]SEK25951.1 glutathione S-transferase [Xaviernesmea oryzae]